MNAQMKCGDMKRLREVATLHVLCDVSHGVLRKVALCGRWVQSHVSREGEHKNEHIFLFGFLFPVPVS